MKVNNKLGLILGLIGGLALLCMSLLMMLVMVIAITFIITVNNEINVLPFTVVSYISLFASILAIIGGIVSYKHAKAGGIILIISTVLCACFPITLATYKLNLNFSIFIIYTIWIIVLAMTLSAGILSLVKKNKLSNPTTTPENETNEKI